MNKIVSLLLLTLLSACGGGGGGVTPTPTTFNEINENMAAPYVVNNIPPGLAEIEIPTGFCPQDACCQVLVREEEGTSVLDTGNVLNILNKGSQSVVEENKLVRLVTQTQGTISLLIIPTDDANTCFYTTPTLTIVANTNTAQVKINPQGDGRQHLNLDAIKVGKHYYLRDISRRGASLTMTAQIQTLKSIGVGDNKFVRHSASSVDNLNPDGADAHANSIATYDYLKDVLGVNGYDDQGSSMLAVTDYLYPRSEITSCGSLVAPGAWFNAFYSGGSNAIYYTPAKPEQDFDKSLSTALNVAAHEWGHGVTGNIGADFIYTRESGALDEAFSDWLGIAVARSTGSNSWEIGLEGRSFRSLQNPEMFVTQYSMGENYKIIKNGVVYQPSVGEKIPYPNTYKGENWILADTQNCLPRRCENDYCGVHTNSSVANKMFYLLSVGGVHNGISVSSIGIETAMKIALDANRNYWNSNSNFHHAKAGMIEVAQDYGNTENGDNIQQQVRLAWEAVGVTDATQP